MYGRKPQMAPTNYGGFNLSRETKYEREAKGPTDLLSKVLNRATADDERSENATSLSSLYMDRGSNDRLSYNTGRSSLTRDDNRGATDRSSYRDDNRGTTDRYRDDNRGTTDRSSYSTSRASYSRDDEYRSSSDRLGSERTSRTSDIRNVNTSSDYTKEKSDSQSRYSSDSRKRDDEQSKGVNAADIEKAINKLLPMVRDGGIAKSSNESSSGKVNGGGLSLAGRSGAFKPDLSAKPVPDRGLTQLFSKNAGGGTSKKDDKQPTRWTCGNCQYYNFATREICNKCSLNRSKAEEMEERKQKEKLAQERAEKAKNAPKEKTKPPVKDKPPNWDCVKCDFHNFWRREKCKDCDTTREESAEYNKRDKSDPKEMEDYTNVVGKLDFGEPGLHVQEGFTKLGIPDGENGNFEGTFMCQGKQATVTITGYMLARGNFDPVTGEYAHLSNLLRSSFCRDGAGNMQVKVTGLQQNTRYVITTYHHSTRYPRGGSNFTLKYHGSKVRCMKQSANGAKPNPPLIHKEIVRTGDEGEFKFDMKMAGTPSHGAHMNINGMEISAKAADVNIGIGRFLSVASENIEKATKKSTTEESSEKEEGGKTAVEWRCKDCKTTNFNKRLSCRMCLSSRTFCDGGVVSKNDVLVQKPKAIDDWVCYNCQNVNNKQRTQCTRCHSVRREVVQSEMNRTKGDVGGPSNIRRKDTSNAQVNIARKAIQGLGGNNAERSRPTYRDMRNAGIPRDRSPQDSRRKNNMIPLDQFMSAPPVNTAAPVESDPVPDNQLPELVRTLAAEEIANKIMQGTLPIANNLNMDSIPVEARRIAAQEIALKIIDGESLAQGHLTPAQRDSIDKMRLIAAEEIAKKIIETGANINTSGINMPEPSVVGAPPPGVVGAPPQGMGAPPPNIVQPMNIMPHMVPASMMPQFIPGASIIPQIRPGFIQPLMASAPQQHNNITIVGRNNQPVMAPANNFGLNVVNALFNVQPENEKFTANERFHTGEVEVYRGNRGKTENKALRPVQEVRGSTSGKGQNQADKGRRGSNQGGRVSNQGSKSSDQGGRGSSQGSRGSSQGSKGSGQGSKGQDQQPKGSNQESKGLSRKERASARKDSEKPATTAEKSHLKPSETTSTSPAKKADDVVDTTKDKQSAGAKGGGVIVLSDSDEDIIDITEEKNKDKEEKDTGESEPVKNAVAETVVETVADTDHDEVIVVSDTKDQVEVEEAAVAEEEIVESPPDKEVTYENPYLSIDTSDEPMYSVVDETDAMYDPLSPPVSPAQQEEDESEMEAEESKGSRGNSRGRRSRSPHNNEPVEKISSWSDDRDLGMVGLLPQVPRTDDLVKAARNNKTRRKRRMNEEELTQTLNDMGVTKDLSPDTIEKKSLLRGTIGTI